MPRHVNPPKSIKGWGGLRPFLNGTKDQHNGLGFSAWKRRTDPSRKRPPSKASIAEDFNVSTRRVYDWLKEPEVWPPSPSEEQPLD